MNVNNRNCQINISGNSRLDLQERDGRTTIQKILFFSSNTNTNKHAAEYKTKHLFSVKLTFLNFDSFSKPVSISRKFFIKKNETQFTTERASALLIELWHRYNLFPR